MGTDRAHGNRLKEPWDEILGTRGQVRVLRTLERVREAMAVRELARRAAVHLRAVQIAVDRLVEAGVIERVGTGIRQQVRLRVDHPLTPALYSLFQTERARFEGLADALKAVVRQKASSAQAVWAHERPPDGGPWLELGVLAESGEVDRLVDILRESIVPLTRREDVPIEVRGWTRPDLEALGSARRPWPEHAMLLWGVLPQPSRGKLREPAVTPRSHQRVDDALRERAERLAAVLARRPELVRLAKEEIAKRLETARPQEGHTLREWQQVLDGMSPARLRRWLVDEGEQATRLRQSMPVTFLRAATEESEGAPRRARRPKGKR
jgi:DNA-binding IclR family transcriptional regulator